MMSIRTSIIEKMLEPITKNGNFICYRWKKYLRPSEIAEVKKIARTKGWYIIEDSAFLEIVKAGRGLKIHPPKGGVVGFDTD